MSSPVELVTLHSTFVCKSFGDCTVMQACVRKNANGSMLVSAHAPASRKMRRVLRACVRVCALYACLPAGPVSAHDGRARAGYGAKKSGNAGNAGIAVNAHGLVTSECSNTATHATRATRATRAKRAPGTSGRLPHGAPRPPAGPRQAAGSDGAPGPGDSSAQTAAR